MENTPQLQPEYGLAELSDCNECIVNLYKLIIVRSVLTRRNKTSENKCMGGLIVISKVDDML